MKILISQKNFVIIQFAKKIVCYSFCELIATFDIETRRFYKHKKDFTPTNGRHYKEFKQQIQPIYIYS